MDTANPTDTQRNPYTVSKRTQTSPSITKFSEDEESPAFTRDGHQRQGGVVVISTQKMLSEDQ